MLKKHLIRAGTIILVFGIAAIVLAYFLGYYDLSFLDRYKIIDELLGDGTSHDASGGIGSLFTIPDETTSGDVTSDAQTSDGQSGADENVERPGDAVEDNYETVNVSAVFTTDRLRDKLLTNAANGGKTVAELKKSGYHIAGSTYSEAAAVSVSGDFADAAAAGELIPTFESPKFIPGQTVLGRLTFDYKLPEVYSRSKRHVIKNIVNYPDDDSEYYITERDVIERRPAVELYMGYIMIDSGGSGLYVASSDGDVLCSLNKNLYSVANCRDKYGRPLFTKVSDPSAYLYLAGDGMTFLTSDYDPAVDGRGLSFDYPTYYGRSDSTAVYVDKNSSGMLGYKVTGGGALTGYNYTSARVFTENRAAVTTTRNRGGMFFINENGQQAFSTWYSYLNEYDRYVFNNLMPPATDGIENIGFYYFEEGLTRVRRQVIDNWNWSAYRRVRVVVDESILIRTDGSEYVLPSGYTLEGYSDGLMLLKSEKSGLYGFMDYTGEWIAQPIYKSAEPSVGGLAVLTAEDGRVGMIDTAGNIILQFTYDYISRCSDGVIAAYREENGWTIYRLMSRE